ncbi:DUF3592 domain-containing protein [Haloplanus litoreus]|uniref:DUF3592 domain-containing protein n=1 Tax=Haloplanus litoreus TaxID=767515 RepID=UPI00360A631D
MEINGPSSRLGIAVLLLVGLASVGYGAYSYDAQSAALDSTATVNATVTDTSVTESGGKTVSASRGRPSSTATGARPTRRRACIRGRSGRTSTPRRRRGGTGALRVGRDGDGACVPTDDPGAAFLERERSKKPHLLIGAGVLFTVVAVYSAIRN